MFYLNVIGVNFVFGKNVEGGVVGSTQEDAATAVVSANRNRKYNIGLCDDKSFH